MDELLEISNLLIASASPGFSRESLVAPAWKERLMAIQGYRGTGKTTLILQHLKNLPDRDRAAYLSLDHFYFQNRSLYDSVKELHQNGYTTIAVDEVHKYPDWSRQLKSLYDTYKNLQLIFSGSSLLEIYKSSADLSRRAVSYHLPVLSLREYIELSEGIRVKKVEFAELLSGHETIATHLQRKLGSPLKYFRNYLSSGCYPVCVEGPEYYHEKLMRTAMLVLDADVAAVTNIPFQSIQKMKKLLAFIAQAVPFKPNITELANTLSVKRETVLQYMDFLQKAGLLRLVNMAGRTMGPLSKPEKIYLDNPNLSYALTFHEPNSGTQRETFFLSQLSYSHNVEASPVSDFLVDGKYTFEIGGKNKNRKQIKGVKNSFVIADDIVVGNGTTIPLWLFGFLY